MKNKDIIRVLHMFHVMDRGGAETMAMNLYRKIDRTRFQFDFCVQSDKIGDYEEEIKALGGNIYRIQPYKVYNSVSYRKEFRNLLLNHPEIRVVHGHIGSSAAVYFHEAKKMGRICVSHAHEQKWPGVLNDLAYRFLVRNIKKEADYLLACSTEAGEYRYGKQALQSDRYELFKNGIDLDLYRFDSGKQIAKKEELGLGEKLVIGNVGRFVEEKNHAFLIDVFKKIADTEEGIDLVLAGRGPLEEAIKEKAKDVGIADRVHFLGVRTDVPDLMIMMDGFIMPSLYEGLPVAGVEAQAAGLPCLFSTGIPEPIILKDSSRRMNLSEGSEAWGSEMLKMISNTVRTADQTMIREAGYDISASARRLEEIYTNLLNQK